jgi:glycosyltransferase involved in cell wall biosynthesis
VSVLNQFDAVVCAGPMQRSLAEKLLTPPPVGPQLYEIPIGVDDDRLAALAHLTPNLTGKRLVCVANGPGEFRSWYKGLDLVAAAFALAAQRVPDLELAIAGDWDDARRADVRNAHPAVADRIRFVGPVSDVPGFLAGGSLGVHLARGDAFPVATLEALAIGLPLVVSEWTGTRGAVEQVDPSLVAPLDPAAAADRIVRYFVEPLEVRQRLSRAARAVGAGYTEQRMTSTFQTVVADILAGRPTAAPGGAES